MKPDYSTIYALPSIKTRYLSMLIDVIVITILSLVTATLIEKVGDVPGSVRGILFAIIVILYEPILISFGATLGQFILEIRVRNFSNPEKKMNFHMAFVRLFVKVLLGWLSFLTVTFNKNRRAIHDLASNSIMITNKIEITEQ